PDDYQHLKNVQEIYHAQEKRLFKIAKRIQGPAFDKYAHTPSQAIDVLEAAIFGENEESGRAVMLQGKYRDLSQPVDPQISEYEKIMLQAGNSPVIPDGYALVPVEPTDEMIVAAMDSDDVSYNESDDTVFYVHHREIYKAMLAAAPKQENV
ncbi:hypothetical protein ACOIWS_005673, partial [Salmonella enterica]